MMALAVIVTSRLTALVATEPDASEKDRAPEPAPPRPRTVSGARRSEVLGLNLLGN